MSKQDDHFFNTFSLVIGSLVAIAIVLFAIARGIGTPFEAALVATEPAVAAGVAANTAPVGRLAVVGQDNSALAIRHAAGGAAPAAPALPKSGAEAFQSVCSACHGSGVGGAPRVGDHAAWAPRLAQGQAALYQHALEGFTGKAGVMLAKGGRSDLPDELVRQTVDYMVKRSQ
ncbi:MAG TPA: c-type cytochrome [Steroidobacteraceae bacterium]|nr:c-type cytochrome [Steroidobacteraceae bacterium]